jgi:hypothetical protein
MMLKGNVTARAVETYRLGLASGTVNRMAAEQRYKKHWHTARQTRARLPAAFRSISQ